MQPSVGRIVLVKIDPTLNNGADVAPAIITRTWGADAQGVELVNVRVLRDGHEMDWKTSVKLYSTREEADASGNTFACYWPPRV